MTSCSTFSRESHAYCNGLQMGGLSFFLQKTWKRQFCGVCSLEGAWRALFLSLQSRSSWWLQMRCCQILLSLRRRSRRALIGLYLLTAEGEDGSRGSQSPDLGDMWRCGGQNKNPSGFVSKTRLWLWQKRWNASKIRFSAGFWFVAWLPVVVIATACSMVGAKILHKISEGPHWEGVWPCLDPWDVVRLRTSWSYWNVLEKYGPQRAFLLPYQEGAGGSHAGSAVHALCPVETHEAGSSGSQSPDLGDMWRCGCPKKPGLGQRW